MKSAKRWSLLLLALGVPVGCAQLIGADEPRELRKAPIATDGSTNDVFAQVPDASFDAQACASNQKRCNGTCVSNADPAFGCINEGCEPCNLPNAKTIACRDTDGKCVAGTCRDGFSDCKEPHKGCGFDLSAPETCTDCGINCVGGVAPLCTPTGCGASCPINTKQCGSSCVDITTHPKHCSGCGLACTPGANGDSECVQGTCRTVCRPGFGHCDSNLNGSCVALQTFYTDSDGDGFGDGNGAKKAGCPGTGGVGFAPMAGDCNDGNKEVFPGQLAYFTVGYKSQAGPISFDYDCNGVETDRSVSAHFAGCTESCAGSGIGPAGSGRTGPGVNDYCGSTTTLTCSGGLTPADPFQSRPMISSSGAINPSCEIKSGPTGANGCK